MKLRNHKLFHRITKNTSVSKEGRREGRNKSKWNKVLVIALNLLSKFKIFSENHMSSQKLDQLIPNSQICPLSTWYCKQTASDWLGVISLLHIHNNPEGKMQYNYQSLKASRSKICICLQAFPESAVIS